MARIIRERCVKNVSAATVPTCCVRGNFPSEGGREINVKTHAYKERAQRMHS